MGTEKIWGTVASINTSYLYKMFSEQFNLQNVTFYPSCKGSLQFGSNHFSFIRHHLDWFKFLNTQRMKGITLHQFLVSNRKSVYF